MDIKMINIGFGNMVSGQRVITIIGPDSAPSSGSSRTAVTRAWSSTPPTDGGPEPY